MPLVTHGQDFRVLHHDRCFDTGFDRKGDFALPWGTHRPGRALPRSPRGRREAGGQLARIALGA